MTTGLSGDGGEGVYGSFYTLASLCLHRWGVSSNLHFQGCEGMRICIGRRTSRHTGRLGVETVL
jgi:hypothetical protein